MPERCLAGFVSVVAYSVQLGKSVEREYAAALEYIAAEFASPGAMRSLADAFDAALDANPYAYPTDYGMSDLVGIEIRKIAVKRNLPRYSIDTETQEVRIYSILHTLQDVGCRFPVDYAEDF